jgi:hypothetical protein
MSNTKYTGVSILTDNPGDYSMYKGAVVVPHGRPEKGQPLEESNYYEFTADKNINDIMRSAGLPAGEIIMGPKSKASLEIPDTVPTGKKRGKRSKTRPEPTPVPAKTSVNVDWEIPNVGKIKSTYSCVDVGPECVALYVADGDTPFIPSDYRKHNQAVYIMTYKGISYKVIYGGLTYKHSIYTVYILLGSRHD